MPQPLQKLHLKVSIFSLTLYRSASCHEAYFGLAKIYFHLNKMTLAIESINKAIFYRKNDALYYLWKGFILYYHLKTRSLTELELDLQATKIYLRDCEQSLYLSYKLNPKSLASRFLLLKITLFMEKHKPKFQVQATKQSQEYAVKISKMDKYLGYIAWSEIYLSHPNKRDLGMQVLNDLIS